MDLRVVGAGLGRTGTHSLKLALEQLLGAPCYHMLEVINRPDQAEAWAGALREEPDWARLLSGYAATVDWPAAAFWPELSRFAPDAVVVLSVRDPQAWWASASETIFSVLARGAPPDDPGAVAELAMINALLEQRFTPGWRDREEAIRAYEHHNATVRAVRGARPTGRVAARRRMGPAVPRPRRRRALRALPPREHHLGLPDDHRVGRGSAVTGRAVRYGVHVHPRVAEGDVGQASARSSSRGPGLGNPKRSRSRTVHWGISLAHRWGDCFGHAIFPPQVVPRTW